jgi:hypothetical protein
VEIAQETSASMTAVLTNISLNAAFKWTVPLYLIDYAILEKDKAIQAEKEAMK